MRLCRTNCAFLSNDGLCVEMMVSGRGRVALGCDEPGNSIFIREGLGKTSRAKTLATFGSRVAPGSTLIHDMEGAHMTLVNKLSLKSQHYNAKLLKGVPDGQNPLGAREPDALLHAVLPEGSSRLQPGRHAGLWL